MSQVTEPNGPDARTGFARIECGATSVRAANLDTFSAFLRYGVFAVLLTRSSFDRVIDLVGGGGGMGLGAVLNVLVIAFALAFLIQRPLIAPFAIFGLWGPFLVAAFGATLYAPDFGSAIRLAFVLVSYWAFFALPFFMFRSRDDLPVFLLVIVASSLIPSLKAVQEIATSISDPGSFRLQSTVPHPNIFAFYLVMLIGLILLLKTSSVVRLPPALTKALVSYIPLLAVFLLLTKTRSAWVAAGLLLVVYAIRFDRRYLAVFLLAPVMLVLDTSFMERLTELNRGQIVDSLKELNENTHLDSYTWRQILWESAAPEILAQPIMGHGLDTFKRSTPEFFPLIGPDGIDAHNFYLQISYEMGFVGLFALVWLLAGVMLTVAKGYRYDRAGIVIMLTIMVGYMLESYSDNMQFYLVFNWYFWFAMGTICAWIRREKLARTSRPVFSRAKPFRRSA